MKRSISLCLLVTLAGCGYLPGLRDPEEVKRDKMIREFYRERVRRRTVPMPFYGRIVDQSGNSVSGAEVTLRWERWIRRKPYLLQKSMNLTSDADGRFSVEGKVGESLEISAITKKGYEWMGEPGDHDYYYAGDATRPIFKPNPNAPVVFTMRKKLPPALVIPHKRDLTLLYGHKYYYDAVRGLLYGPRSAKSHEKYGDAYRDVEIEVEKSEDGSKCSITFKAPDAGDGVVFVDKVLYTAPERGYESVRVFDVPIATRPPHSKPVLHMHVRSRSGQIYWRLDGTIVAFPEHVDLSFDSHANPDGDRNLDFDMDMYRHYLDQPMGERLPHLRRRVPVK